VSERDIKRLLALVEKQLGVGWMDVSDWLRGIDANSLDAIEARLVAGDIQGVVREVEQAARMFAADTHAAFTRSGQAGAKWLDTQPQLADKLVRFDVTNHRAIAAARRNEIEWVQGITQDTRQMAHSAILDGQRRSANPREVARDIREGLGLTPAQSQHVANYRRALEQGDFANAMGRELHDARSNRMLRRLARSDGSLTPAQIDKMTESYRRSYIAYRAETIARTESARNVHAGLDESFRQAVERGEVEADSLVREWIAGPRTRHAREQHQDMDGSTVPFGQPFVAPDGTRLMYPGDGPPEHSANCRCTVSTTVA